jgi:beta-phosphoglucomutase-like phosphatase (HAD superfamily)
MIKALIFDFDGLILDTEVPEYQSWVELYQTYGSKLPLDKWLASIGTTNAFNPYEYLEQQLGQPIDRPAVRTQRRARFAELMADQTILPGVQDHIVRAKPTMAAKSIETPSAQIALANSVRRTFA